MNILLVTGIYPTGDSRYQGTTVCHYFAQEWKKAGHNVRVIHVNNVIPKFYTYLGNLILKISHKKIWSLSLMPVPKTNTSYSIDDIPVLYIPIVRPFPKRRYVPQCLIRRAVQVIYKELEHAEFYPQVIVGHWATPIVAELKDYYPKVRNGVVIHEPFDVRDRRYLDKIDSIGFRNKGLQDDFEVRLGKRKREFICYSGVPSSYVINSKRVDSKPINRFVYVGKLIPLKRIQNTIYALKNVYGEGDFVFNIVGDGPERSFLEGLVADLSLQGRIIFHGQVERNEAQRIVSQSQCMVMVSDHEAFGLVYLEAMAKGCICIATKGQGGDGVVIDRENGFLCRAKDLKELSSVISLVATLSKEDYLRMSSSAISTAQRLTDENVARMYLDSVVEN